MKFLFLSVVVFGVSNLASAGVFKATFERVSAANDPKRCVVFAAETAQELTRQTGAQIIDAGCERDDISSSGLNALITYQAESRFNRVSTHHPSPYSSALYTSWEDCNAQLGNQKEIFRRNTGLAALAAYCMKDLSLSRSRWTTRVDGLGNTENKPGVAAVMLWGTIAKPQAVVAKLTAAAKSYNLEVSEGGVDSGGIGAHLVIRYYAVTPMSLQDYDQLAFDTESTCESAAATSARFLEPTSKPVVVFCEHNPSNGSFVLHVTNFAETLQPVAVFKAMALTTRYETVSACEAGLKTVTSVSDVYGALCAGTRNSYRVHLFTKP